ncbi:MAG: DNA polymerase III subunit gamma/tau [Nitrospirales bacterium]|nr:DNA polymerase III subunit gamma/tau [Nitrospirales bacterium]
MDYQVFARKYRPGTFQDLIGQPHVVQTLTNAILGKRVAHAYLFSGMRGVGKTTVARILAKALNCQQGPTDHPCERCESCTEITRGYSVDVIEIDGASNTGVDDVRELRENVKFVPFHGSYRVYIIDEVHMLSNSAFNALLKTLEEPPSHAVFIFATTEIHKIPATILSRCQHFNFRRIPRLEIIQRLHYVAEQNQVTIEEKGLVAIARASDGSMRDALSLLDQAVAFVGNVLTLPDLERLLGAIPEELVRCLLSAVIHQNTTAAITAVSQVVDQGYDLRTYCREITEKIRNLLIANVVPVRQEVEALMDLPSEELDFTLQDAKTFSANQIQELFEIFSHVEDTLRITNHPQFALEVAVVRATRLKTANQEHSASAQGPTPEPTKKPQETPPAQQKVSEPPSRPVQQQTAPAINKKQGPSPSSPVEQQPAPPPRKVEDKPQHVTPPLEASAPGIPLSETIWETVVDRMIKEHPNIGSFLEMGTLVAIEQNQIVIGFQKSASVACSRIQKEENRRLIVGFLKEIVQRTVQVRVIELTDKQTQQPSFKQTRVKRQETEEQALVAEAKNHPLVKEAIEIFGGDVVAARRIPTKEEE